MPERFWSEAFRFTKILERRALVTSLASEGRKSHMTFSFAPELPNHLDMLREAKLR